VVTEVGSGLNGKRPKLKRLLADPQVTVITVEHRDRLARFGREPLEAALSAQARRLVKLQHERRRPIADKIDVLTSF
jgi:putative resolvase